MIDFTKLKVGQVVQMLTLDVSGAYIVPCEIISVDDTEAVAGSSTGAQVFISKHNESEFFLDEADCVRAIGRDSKKYSYWN